MKLWLNGHPHPIRQQVTVLGRDTQADLAVLSAEVSRRHAFLVSLGGERYLLLDYKSANGTRLNGRRIDSALLRDGDQIDLAGAVLTVETENRRAGSMAATGSFKSLLRLEDARRGEEETSLVELWNENLQELAAILPRLAVLRSTGELAEACQAVLGSCLAYVQGERGLLFLVDDEGAALRIRAEVGYPGGRGLRRNLHQALVDEAVDNDRLVSTRSRFFEEVFGSLTRGGRASLDVSSAMAVPLSMCGSPLGALYVERRRGAVPFEARQRKLLRFLAQLTGPQLATLYLEKQVQERLAVLQVVDVRMGGDRGSCEVCGEDLERTEFSLVQCAACLTYHHLDCWNFLGHCAIFGCGSEDARPVVRAG